MLKEKSLSSFTFSFDSGTRQLNLECLSTKWLNSSSEMTNFCACRNASVPQFSPSMSRHWKTWAAEINSVGFFWWKNYYKSVLRWLTIFHETTFFTMFSVAFDNWCNIFTVINCLVSFLGYPKDVSSLILNHIRYRHHHYFQGMYNCIYFITVMWIYKEVNSSSVRDNRIE